MKNIARVAVAVAFFGVLFGLLLLPALTTDEDGSDRAATTPEPTRRRDERPRSPRPSPQPSPTPRATGGGLALAGRVPRACLKRAGPPEGYGHVAALDDGRVTIASATGGTVTSLAAGAPLEWSASGNYLMTGDGVAFTSDGARLGRPLGPPQRGLRWALSPTADCAVAFSGDGLVAARIGRGKQRPARLLDGNVVDAAFSPDGRRLALALHRPPAGPGIWLIDLAGRRARRVSGVDLHGGGLHGWDARGVHLFYSADEGALSYLSRRRKVAPGIVKSGFRPPLETCGRQTLAIVNDRPAYVTPAGPRHIAAPGYVYSAPACSADGRYVAIVRAPDEPGETDQAVAREVDERRLVLLTGGGDLVRPLTEDRGYADEHPTWGPPRTGILFIRRRLLQRNASPVVWFIPEGGRPGPTGLTVQRQYGTGFRGYFAWPRFLDWSVVPPSGMTVR